MSEFDGVFPVLDELLDALRVVPDLRVHGDPGALVDPPAGVLSPPTFVWDGMLSEPTAATVTLALVAPQSDRALRTLLRLLGPVVAAIDSVPDAVVRTAAPGTFAAGDGVDLPAYLIEIEVIP